MLRSTITVAVRYSRPETRRTDGRLDVARLHRGQGDALEAARPRGGSERHARLLVREAARAAAGREARRRRRGHGEEAAPAPGDPARAVGEARGAGAGGASPPGARISRGRRSSASRASRRSCAGSTSRSPRLEQQQEGSIQSEKQLQAKIEAFRSQKEVIKAQYSAAEAQVRIGEAATGIGEQMADTGLAIERARDKTEQMQARASAIEELTAAGTLEDFTQRQDAARPRARGS